MQLESRLCEFYSEFLDLHHQVIHCLRQCLDNDNGEEVLSLYVNNIKFFLALSLYIQSHNIKTEIEIIRVALCRIPRRTEFRTKHSLTADSNGMGVGEEGEDWR